MFILLMALFMSLPAFSANESSQTFTLDGQLYQSGTTTLLLDANAKLTIQIIDSAGNCLLYEEEQTLDTFSTKGQFTVHVGSNPGSTKRTVNDPGRTMAQVFQNIAPIAANSVAGRTCTGSSYTPFAGAIRYFRLIVTPSATHIADTLQPDLVIDSVPSALVAQSVQGLERTQILQTNTSGSTVLSQANLEAAFTGTAYTNLQAILGGNFMRTDTSGATLPSYASTPPGVAAGDIWFDSTTNQIKYQTSGGVQTVGAAGGSAISSLTVGSGMSLNGTVAGTISSGSATIDLSNTGVGAGTYTKVVVDAKGRVTAGTVSLVEADIPNLTVAGKVSGNTITSGTISGSTGINTSGNLISTGTVSGLTVQATNLRVFNGANYVQLAAPALGGNVNLTLPSTDGNANEFLKTDGSGVLSWATATVTSVDVTTALGYTPLNVAATFSGDVTGTYNTTSVDKIKGKSITAATTSGQMMIYNGTAWVNSVISGDATLAHDGMLSLNKVPVSKGGTNATSFGNNRLIASNGSGSTLQDFTCSINQVVTFNGSGEAICANLSSLSPAILNGGNTTGADISIGTNDNKALKFKTNDTIAMTISQSGNIGIGTSAPASLLNAVSGVSDFRFSQGASNLTPTMAVINTNASGKAGALVAGTVGAAFVFDSSGVFSIQTDTKANFVNNTAGAGTNVMTILGSNGYVGLGTISPSSVMDINGALTAQGMSSAPAVSPTNTGRIYYDFSANKFKVSQNGGAYTDLISTATGGIISFGGQSGASQTLAISVDNSVSTPTITSASDTHTWKIPMASNAGTTAGLLNKTDYDSFVAKLGTATIFAGDVSGTYNSTIVQKIQGKAITAASVSGQIMIYDGTAWTNNVVSGDATLAHNGIFTLNKVPVTKGGTNATSFGNNRIIASNGTGSAFVDFTCSLNQVITFDASGNSACANVSSLITALVNGGNTTGADISAGTNDNKALHFKTNNSIAMTISQGGNIGIGTTTPNSPLEITTNNALTGSANLPRIRVASGTNGGTVGAGLAFDVDTSGSSQGLVTAKIVGIRQGGNGIGDLAFYTNQSGPSSGDGSIERMRITSTGNVGIGISVPTSALTVSGAVTAQGMSSAPSVSDSNTGRIYYDYAANKFKVSQNGAAYVDLINSTVANILNGGNTTGADISIGTNDNKALHFKTNNSTAMTISQGGRVGIGTVAPAATLDVNGSITTMGNGGTTNFGSGQISATGPAGGGAGMYVNISNTGSSYGGFAVGYGTTTKWLFGMSKNISDTTGLVFYEDGAAANARMTIATGGKVGIGNTAPTANLDVRSTGNSAVSGYGIRITASDSGTNGGYLTINKSSGTGTNGTIQAGDTSDYAPLAINPNGGFVGIGTASPTGILDVQGGTSTTGNGTNINLVAQSALASGNTNGGNIYLTPGTANGSGLPGTVVVGSTGINFSSGSVTGANPQAGFNGIYSSGPNRIDFGTNGVNRFSVLSNGNVVMGSDTTKVVGNNFIDYGTNANGFAMDNSGSYMKTQGTVRLTVDNTGKVGIGGAAASEKLEVVGNIKTSGCLYYASSSLGTCASDERIKEGVRPFELGLDQLLGIVPVHFKYNGLAGFPKDGKEQLGVIAQQVEKVAPQLIQKQMVTLHQDDQKKTEIKVVDYGAFTYLIINSVKDLYRKWFDDSKALHRELASVQTQIAEKDQKIKKLEQENESIKHYLCQKDPKAPICKK